MHPEAEEPSLRGVLETERACCARLLPILDAERAAAAAYDHAALLACLKEREAIQAEWQRAAATRRRRLRRAGEAAALVAGDPDLAVILEGARQQAAVVRRAQRVNEGLIRAVLAQVTGLLTVIRRELPESRYDGRATLMTPLPSPGGSWRA
jgi:hypothetical protein